MRTSSATSRVHLDAVEQRGRPARAARRASASGGTPSPAGRTGGRRRCVYSSRMVACSGPTKSADDEPPALGRRSGLEAEARPSSDRSSRRRRGRTSCPRRRGRSRATTGRTARRSRTSAGCASRPSRRAGRASPTSGGRTSSTGMSIEARRERRRVAQALGEPVDALASRRAEALADRRRRSPASGGSSATSSVRSVRKRSVTVAAGPSSVATASATPSGSAVTSITAPRSCVVPPRS